MIISGVIRPRLNGVGGTNFVVSGVIGHKKSKIRVIYHGCDAYQSGSPSRHNADVFPSILALFSLTVVGVVQICNRHP